VGARVDRTVTVTYVYCIVASARPPRLAGVPRGLPGTEPPRLLAIGDGLFAIVASAPLKEYGEAAINQRLGELDWVSAAAVSHESVVEHFVGADAVLPMKLFTIFTDDDRVVAHMRGERARLAATARRVAKHQEWGVRVLLDRTTAAAAAQRRAEGTARRSSSSAGTGAAYRSRKKAHRDASVELRTRARETVARLYDRLAAKARLARRRAASELPAQGGSLLLDAAFLVARSRARTFRALAAREARDLAPHGYQVDLTGPWPPYTFVQD
jgi:hypothetical protein